jgi:hypothetical protein
MSVENKSGRPAQPVARVCEAAEVSGEARALLQADMAPQSYVELLAERGQFSDAVRFLAHALPKREAVWWAWFCARSSSGPNPPAVIQASLSATEKWITKPTDENRRGAMNAAQEARLGTAAACAGLGAFFSGESLAPPNAPVVPPGEFMTAKAVAGAVMIAAVASAPEEAPERYRAYIAQGIQVARKINLWQKGS